MKWTDSAQEEFKNLFERIRSSVSSSGADPAEVEEDLKRHIEEELARVGMSVVSKDYVTQIFIRIYPTELADQERKKQPKKAGMISHERSNKKKISPAFEIAFGIVLPIITLSIEAFSGFCASTFFDPIPTVWHIILVALVPIINIQLLWFLRSDHHEKLLYFGTICGISFGVSLYYSLLFLPLTPVAVFAIIAFGLGILPLTPFLSFWAILALKTKLKDLVSVRNMRRIPGFIPGVIFPILIISLIELPDNITKYGLRLAASEVSTTQIKGIQFLRTFGNEEIMLKACYTRPGRMTDLIGFILAIHNPITTENSREIYYRVTGIPFNSVPPPQLTGRGRFRPGRDFIFDRDRGGTMVGGKIRDLWLDHSRLDGSIDADAALAYLEWTMEFKNQSDFQQHEARAKIKLPPHAVVSRLTLWINDEEREAAFAARGKVTEAYTSVVRQKRDPVLVTTSGPDRILVQCFPVPPRGGTMKIRIGITTPLEIEASDTGILWMPYLYETNFSISSETSHSVWVEAQSELHTNMNEILTEHPSENLHAIRGKLLDNRLSHSFYIKATRNTEIKEVWAVDTIRKDKPIIRQTLSQTKVKPPDRLIVVIDGSKLMSGFINPVIKVLDELPENMKISVLIASDEIHELTGEHRNSLEQELHAITFEGGCDNAPALSKAWEIASNSRNSALVWIHTQQPLLTSDFEELRQKLERRPNGMILYEVQCGQGPNKIIEKLDGLITIHSLRPVLNSPDSVADLFRSWQDSTTILSFSRAIADQAFQITDMNSKETSLHLVRLWAFEEISQLIARNTSDSKDQAIQLSMQYSLVTPVSGAVVLENTAQYEQSKLKPVTDEHIPTIPEPGIWLLLLVILPILTFLYYRERTRCSIKA